jgi:hypothetical protein
MHTSYRTKVAQDKIITHIDFIGKAFSVAHTLFATKNQTWVKIYFGPH